MDPAQVEKGLEKLKEINEKDGLAVYERLLKISPFLADYLMGSFFAEMCSIPEIDNKTREVAIIGGLTALGNTIPQLKFHIRAGLNVGLTKDEIIAIINTMSGYAGFPVCLNALYAAQEIFQEEGI